LRLTEPQDQPKVTIARATIKATNA
jgi:hypothetical protein